jgi:hypothetical protein
MAPVWLPQAIIHRQGIHTTFKGCKEKLSRKYEKEEKR